jgi:3-hydroxyisobutyrate dehydrogenase
VLERLGAGGVVVDLTTSEPALASELAAVAERTGRHVLDAPVTGGDKGAIAGTLSVLVGGEDAAVARVMPLFNCFAATVSHFGGAGMGQHAKAANQITIATQMVGLAEGLVYAQAAGLDLEKYVGAIAGGGAGGKTVELYARRTLAGDFQPGFFVEHFVKDLGIALESCRKMRVSLPGLALASQLYNSLAAHGEHRLGTQALVKVLERMNNVRLETGEGKATHTRGD